MSAPQLDLFGAASPAQRERKPTIEERALAFHRDHPEVYDRMVELAREAKAAGSKRGAKAIWEVMRWDFEVARAEGERFALNNDFPAMYARWIMAGEPDLEGFFEIRERKAA